MKQFFKAFPEKYPKIWEFIKFVFTAFSTTILYYIVFWVVDAILEKPLAGVEVHNAILSFLGYDENLGLAIAYLSASFLSYAASYVMNRKVTFKSNSNVLKSTVLFALMVVVTTAFTAWFGTSATKWAENQGGFWASGFVSSFLIPTVAMLIPFVWTFPFQKYVIYRNKPVEEDTEAVQADVQNADEGAEESTAESADENTQQEDNSAQDAEKTEN